MKTKTYLLILLGIALIIGVMAYFTNIYLPANPSTSSTININKNKISGLTEFVNIFGNSTDNYSINYWKFDETTGTNALDIVSSNNGTITNGVWVQGKINNGLNFTGTGQVVSINNGISGTNARSYTLWAYPVGDIYNRKIVIMQGDCATNTLMISFIGNAISEGQQGSNDFTGATLSAEQWYFIALTINSSTIALYVNGTLYGSVSSVGWLGANGTYYIGDGGGACAGKNFGGIIDEVGIWNRTLTPSEITALYNSGNGLAPSEAPILDAEYPQFSNYLSSPNNTEYDLGKIYQFNTTIISTNGTAGIEFNAVNYSLSNISTSFYRDFGNLSVGNYPYYFWAYGNGTDKLYNKTQMFYYNLAKNSSYVLGITKTSPITYPRITDFTGTNCIDGLSCSLNISNAIYGAGTIWANYSTDGNENYTASSITTSITINKNQTNLGLTATSPITYGTTTNFAGSDCNSEISCSLNLTNAVFSAGVISANYSTDGNENYTGSSAVFSITIDKAIPDIVSNVTSPITYGTTSDFACSGTLDIANQIFGVGTIYANCSVTENQNYTANSTILTLIVNQATGNIALLLNNVAENINISFGNSVNASASSSSGQTIQLFRNGDDVTSENNILNSTLGVGYYNYTALALNNQNYSQATISRFLNITAIPDTNYPQFSNFLLGFPDNTQYGIGKIYQFNTTIISTNGTAGIEFNAVNYSLNRNGNSFYLGFIGIGAGTYPYYFWAYGNGTDTLYNKTAMANYNIIANSTYILGISVTSPINFGTSTDFSGTGCPSQLTCALNITNGIYGAGIVYANYTTAGNTNFSGSGVRGNVTINPINSSVFAYIENARQNYNAQNDTLTGKANVLLNGTIQIGEGNIELILNGNIINTGSSPLSNLTNLSLGNYNFTAYLPATQNYSASQETWLINITATTPDTIYPIFSNFTDNNGSLVGSGTAHFGVTIINSNGTAILHINGTNILATHIGNVYSASKGLTNGTYAYNWTAYGSGGSNLLNTSVNRNYVVENVIVGVTPLPNDVTNTPIYQVLSSTGAGIGILSQVLGASLPVLLIGLAIIGFIVSVILAIVFVIKHSVGGR
jgi:hypothetical protein